MKINNYVRLGLSVSLKVFILVIGIICSNEIVAQTPQYHKGTGTSANTIPMSNPGSHCQQIYVPTDFQTLPISGNITKIYFRNSTAGASSTYSNFQVSFLQNTQTTFANSTFLTGFTNALSVPSITINGNATAGGWYEIPLAIPFAYNNSQTLIVEIKYTARVLGPIGTMSTPTTSPGGNKRLSIIVAPGPTTGTLSATLGDFGMDVIPAGGCTSPPTPGIATKLPTFTVCPGNTVQLNLSGNSTGSGQTYLWDSSSTGTGGWGPIGVAQAFANKTINPLKTMFYRCAVTCSTNTQYSSPNLEVTVSSGLPGGTYTINPVEPSPDPTNFQSFTEAVAALNCGINGSVIFNVVPGHGPYNEQITIPQIGGASASRTVTFNGFGDTLQFANTVTAARHVLKIDGADYVTINDLVIKGNGTTYAWGVHLLGGADHITLNHCTIDNTANTSTTEANSAGIIASSSTSAFTGTGTNASFLTVSNCTIKGGYKGITLYGISTSLSLNNIITGNTIQDFYADGILLNTNNGTQVVRNDIHRKNRTTTVTTFAGVTLETGCKNVRVDGNKFHDTQTSSSTLTSINYGVYLDACDAPLGEENKIINNLIYKFNTSTGTTYGLYNSSSDGAYYYHNTVVLDNPTSVSGTTRGFYQTTLATNIKIFNNIISVTRGGSGTKHCLYFGTTTSQIFSNNNVLYLNPNGASTAGIGSFGTSNAATLASWRTANNNAYDQNSLDADPTFTSPVDGNFSPLSPLVNNTGVSVGVSTDILNHARSLITPDPGAYEFSLLGLDADIEWTSPVAPFAPGAQMIEVKITNGQAVPITSVNLSYTDGIITRTENFTGFNITTLGSHQLSFAIPYDLSSTVNMKVYVNNVNGVQDLIRSDDTTYQMFCLPMTGIYTINSDAPTFDRSYNNFTDAVNNLSCAGITGPVTINVTPLSGPYNEQLSLPAISGTSVVNTITFNGNGEELTFASSNVNQKATFKLNGADFVTLNNLVLTATGTQGFVVQMMNNSDNNKVTNCKINNSLTVTSTVFAGIVINSSATSAVGTGSSLCDNNTISDNIIKGGYYGITIFGNGTTSMVNNNKVLNNKVLDFYQFGIYLGGNNNGLVENNEVSRPNRTTVTAFRGIAMSGASLNTKISKNRIFAPFENSITSTANSYMISILNCDATLGNENIISNNITYNQVGSTGDHHALLFQTSSYAKIYHNSFYQDYTDAACVDCPALALYQAGTSENDVKGLDIQNNIIVVGQGGPAAKACILFDVTDISAVKLDNNVYLMASDTLASASGAQHEIARVGGITDGTGYTTLAAWQTATGKDANSIIANPKFTNAGAGNLAPTSYSVDNIGASLGITTDFNSAPRSLTSPDPGAYEFTVPPAFDLRAMSLVTPVPFRCHSSVQNVVIQIMNFGNAPIDFATSPALVTCKITGQTTATLTGSPSGILNAGKSMEVILTGTFDMSIPGDYTFKGYTTLPGDANTSNDTMPVVNQLAEEFAVGAISTVLTDYCATGSPVFTLSDNKGGDIQWQSSTVSSSGPWLNVGTGGVVYAPGTITQTTYYQAVLSCDAIAAATDVVTISVNNPPITVPAQPTRCGYGSLTLTAGSPAGTSIRWYENQTGGALLATGSTFVTPAIGTTTTYFAAAVSDGSPAFVGRLAPVSATSTTLTTYGLSFTLTEPVNFGSVEVYSGTGTSITVSLFDSAGTTQLMTTGPNTVTPNNQSTIHLGWFLAPGTYRIAANGMTLAFMRESSGATYPIPLATFGKVNGYFSSITGSLTTSGAYYWFYNWLMTGPCEGTRTPIEASIIPPPPINPTTTNAVLCSGSAADLDVTSPNAGYSYEWMPGNLSGALQEVTPDTSTDFIITATDNVSGCVNVDTVKIHVQPDSVKISATPEEICLSGISTLSLTPAVGYSENSIQWLRSSDNSNFTVISGENESTYTTPTLTNTTVYYRAQLTDGNNAVCGEPSIRVRASTPGIAVTTPSVTRCGTGPVTLSALGTGIGTVKWYSSPTGSSFLSEGNNFIPNVSASTNYYVEQSFGSTGGTPLVISEIDIGTIDRLEVMNVSGKPLDVTGWKVAVSNSNTVITTVNANVQTLNGTLAPGAILSWTESTAGPNYWGSAIHWNPGAYPSFTGWAVILNAANQIVDFVPLNWPAAIIQGASFTIGTTTITIGNKWVGDGIDQTNVPATQSISRQGNSDNNNSADFAIKNLSLESINPGMLIPFTGFACASNRSPVEVFVNPAPPIDASATSIQICPGGSTTLNAASPSNPDYSYVWNPGDLAGSSVTVNPFLHTDYTVSAHDGSGGIYDGCDITSTVTISTFPEVAVTALANPQFISFGGNSALNAIASTTASYAMNLVTPSPVLVPGTGFGTLDKNTSVSGGDLDDGFWKITPPFAISFFGEQYGMLYVGTNGYLSFSAGDSKNTPPTLPAVATPNNAIYLAEYDWDYRTSGKIKYFTTGAAPFRRFVLNYENVPRFSGIGLLNGQIIISEGSGQIDLVLSSGGGNTTKTLGIENATGSVAYAPSPRNGVAWDVTSTEQWQFAPSGGSFTYAWSPSTYLDDPNIATPFASSIFGDITYSVNVADITTGCSTSNSVSIFTGVALSVTGSTIQSVICSGDNTIVSASVTGGSAPYSYAWDDGNDIVGSTSFVSVSPNTTTTYHVLVTDNVGNTAEEYVTITVNPKPVVTATQGLICGSGTATLTATSTLPGTTLTWTPSTALNTTEGPTVISSTTVTRTYSVTGTTANFCSHTVAAKVTVSSAVADASALATPDRVCNGGNVTLSASGIAALPGFSINTTCTTSFIDIRNSGTSVPGAISDDSEHNLVFPVPLSFNGVIYTAARVSSNGVVVLGSTSGDVTFTNAALPTTTVAAGNLFLAPFWDDLDIQMGATIKTQLIGSNFIIQYTNFSHNSFTTGAITFQIQINMLSGKVTYVYDDVEFGSVTYDKGISATVGLQLSSASAMQFSFNTALLTNGKCISFVPASLPLFYSWTGPGSFSSALQNPVITGIGASGNGTYQVTISTSAGCSATASTSVLVGAPLGVSTSSTANNICAGLSTTLNSTVTGGGLPYSYSWKDGPTVLGTTPSITITPPVGTKTYSLTVTDNCGNSVNSTLSVTVLATPSVSITKSGDICGVGSSTLTASGSGLAYNWNPETKLDASDVAVVHASPTGSTTYTVTSTGANNCTNTATVLLNVYPIPSVNASATPATLCVGGNSQLLAEARYASGFILFTEITPFGAASVANGVTNPYPPFRNSADDDMIEISNVSNSAIDVSGLIFELYTSTTLNRSYSIPAGTTIPAFSVLILHIGPGTDDVANRYLHTGGSDDPIGSGTGYGFILRSGTAIIDAVATNTYSWPAVAGVTAADWSGPGAPSLSSDAGSIRVAATDNNTGTDWSTSDATLPQTIGTFNGGYVSPPIPSFSYSWSPATYLSNTQISNPVANGVSSSITYQVTVTDASTTCVKTQPLTISAAPLAITASASNNTICNGGSVTLQSSLTGGKAPFIYSWKAGIAVVGTTPSLAVSPAVTTTYQLTVTDVCGATVISNSVLITVNPLPNVVVTPPGGSICNGTPASIPMVVSGADSYVWSPGLGLSATSGSNVNASSEGKFVSTNYTVTGTFTATGCSKSAVAPVYRNTFTANAATATPSSVCGGIPSQLNSISTVKANPALLITEITQFSTGGGKTTPRPSYFGAADDDFVEISNLSNDTLAVGGLIFELWTGESLNRSYTIPAAATIPGHGVLVLHIGTGTNNVANHYYHTAGTSNPLVSTGGYGYLLKSGSSILDAVATTNISGATFNWAATTAGVSAATWSGTIPFTAGSAGVIRTGGYDNNTADDWQYASPSLLQTIGTYSNYYASNSQPSFNYVWTPATHLDDATVGNPVFTTYDGGTFNYTVVVTEPASGCSQTSSTSVTVSPLPTVTLSGPSSACTGTSINLSFAFTGLGPWTYSFTDGTTTFGPFTSASPNATQSVTPTGAGGSVITYTPDSIADSRCEGIASSLLGSAAVTIWSYSSIDGITLTSNKPFNNSCIGDNIILSMNGITPSSLGTGAHWKWYSGSCTSGIPVPGSTDMTSITVSPTVNTTYYVRAEGNCNTTPCLSLPVIVSTAPPSGNPGLAYAPTIAFAGGSDSIRVNAVPGATFYHWTTNGNSNILFDGQPAPYMSSSPKVTLTFISPATSGNGIGNYHIQFFAANGCGTTNSNNIRIRSTVEAPSGVKGTLVACPGQTKTYTVSPLVVGAKTYQWSFLSGTGSISGNGTQTVNVTFNTLPAVLCVHGVSAFGSSGPDYCINITTVTATPGPISGNLTPCQGGSAVYSIDSVEGAISYNWTTNIPGASISGSGTSATANFPTGLFNGSVFVTAYSGCGTSLASSLALTAGTVPPLGGITGIINGVCNATSVNYQVPSTGATSYNWTVPSGATIQLLSQGTNSILVDFTNAYAGGKIKVVSTNVCGIANDSLFVTGAPSPPLFTEGPSSACDETYGYTVTSNGATDFIWSVIGGDTIETANANNILVTWNSLGGAVAVVATNSCGISATTVLNVTSNCRMAGSNAMMDRLQALVFPNPSQGHLTLQFNNADESNYVLKITDITGRVLTRETLKAIEGLNQKEINLSEAAKGVYMLTMENHAGDKIVIRLVID